MCQREYLTSRIFKLLLVLLKRAYFPRIAVSHKCFSHRESQTRDHSGSLRPKCEHEPLIASSQFVLKQNTSLAEDGVFEDIFNADCLYHQQLTGFWKVALFIIVPVMSHLKYSCSCEKRHNKSESTVH